MPKRFGIPNQALRAKRNLLFRLHSSSISSWSWSFAIRGEKEGKSQIGSLPFESGGVEESLEGAQHPEIEPSPIGCGCRKVLEPNCPSNFITAGFKTTEGLSRDLERERDGVC